MKITHPTFALACVLVLVTAGSAHAAATVSQDRNWTLATDDTLLTLAVSNNAVWLTSLQNPAQKWNWVPSPSPMPMPAVKAGDADRTNLNGSKTGAQLMDEGLTVSGMTGDCASEIIWIETSRAN